MRNRAERGDVVLVPFPNSDLRTAKLRPALIVQSDSIESELSQVMVAMISSNLQRAGKKSRVAIEIDTEAGRRSGLRSDSVIMTDNLATILRSEVVRTIGRLEDMSGVDKALCHSLGL
jgi:mRNA interferase MazF